MTDSGNFQAELDLALINLTEQITNLGEKLIVKSDDDYKILFSKFVEAKREIGESAHFVRGIFVELVDRVNSNGDSFKNKNVEWIRDEFGNISRNYNVKYISPCSVCGEARHVQLCHIIPRHICGSNRQANILYLCPNHHNCFDSGTLTRDEWQSIDWRGKGELSKSYATEVLLKRQELTWGGEKVVANMKYHGFPPLNIWIAKHTEFESIGDLMMAKNRRKKNFPVLG